MLPLIHVFDLGNVLIFVDEELFFRRLREGCRAGVPAEEVFREEYEREAVDRGGDFDSLHPVLVRKVGLKMTREELRQAWNDIFTLNPPMVELVSQVARPRFLLSNTNAPHVEWIGERYPEVFPLFDRCVFSNEVGVRKPEAAVFRHVESLSGEAAERHVLIDDQARHIAGARAAGWQGIEFQEVEDCRRRLGELSQGPERKPAD